MYHHVNPQDRSLRTILAISWHDHVTNDEVMSGQAWNNYTGACGCYEKAPYWPHTPSVNRKTRKLSDVLGV